jgi:hypothetical protein
MISWLYSTWISLWPNLLANVLWVPLAYVHHRMIKRKLREVNDNVAIQRNQSGQ